LASLSGKVALVTGAARGQGRSHAITLAEAGADIVAVDICATPATIGYAGATPADLEETVAMVEALDRRIFPAVVDVADRAELIARVQAGAAQLGGLDIACANAGIWSTVPDPANASEIDAAVVWQETIDINLTGVWNTIDAAAPLMIEGGRGGAIVLTSSTAGIKAMGTIGGIGSHTQVGQVAYTAAKHGVVGLMRSYALELARHNIRVNTIHPTGVATPMVQNAAVESFFGDHPELTELVSNPIPVDMVDPADISAAVLYLVSDAARYVTGATLPVDAGYLIS
jgi:SDR family mycofactocin-dependent oxidoreductase